MEEQNIDAPYVAAEPGIRTYWLSVFTIETWQEFINAGANVASFRAYRWKGMQKMNHTSR